VRPPHHRVERRVRLGRRELRLQFLPLGLGLRFPRRTVLHLASNRIDLRQSRQGFVQVECCVAHQHVNKLDHQLKVGAETYRRVSAILPTGNVGKTHCLILTKAFRCSGLLHSA
jgi:hypothetical protein